jgi:hypothetical protein
MGHLPFNFLKSAIFLPVPVSCKLQRQIEARRSRSRDDFDNRKRSQGANSGNAHLWAGSACRDAAASY